MKIYMRYIFGEVRAELMSEVNAAKFSSLSFEGYDFEQIHYWNWLISKYNNQAIDPSNLFPATKNMYEIITICLRLVVRNLYHFHISIQLLRRIHYKTEHII